MKSPHGWLSRIGMAAVALALMLACTGLIRGQESSVAPSASALSKSSKGVPWDWTQHHVIFSHPGTSQEALERGHYERWLEITNNPRYILQQRKRSGAGAALAASAPEAEDRPAEASSEDEGETAEAAPPMTEADFPGGVLPRGLAHALTPPRAPEGRGLVSFPPPSGPPRLRPPGLANRLHKDWSETEGSNGTSGLGNYPATFTGTASPCTTDYAVFNAGLAGSTTQASIVAFDELYTSCTGGPAVYWALNTGGTIATSLVLSFDGTQVAFVQNNSGVANLVVLKWAAGGTVASPATLTSNSSYPSCTAPCMISLPLSGSPSDTYSSLFYDYSTDSGYVGDDAGKLHKFTHVFNGSATVHPAEATTSWPVTLNTSTDAALGSPIYDANSGMLFIGDYLANISSSCQPGIVSAAGQCGYLYSVNVSTLAVVQSAQLDYNQGIYDSPIIDPVTEMVYVFVGADNSTSCASGPCAGVFQFPEGFSAGATGTEAQVGAGYEFLMSGAFDNQYFISTPMTSPSGHLYVVGGTGPQNNTLYAITFTSGVMSTTATAGPTVANNYANGYYAAGLQVSEFYTTAGSGCSGGCDYLFLGVLGFGSSFSSNPCPTQSVVQGCVMGFTAPASGTIASGTSPNGTLVEAGGTSGIVVDNGTAGESNIYFSTLLNQPCTTSGSTGGCAIQTSQSAP